jgi:hypothetical protein
MWGGSPVGEAIRILMEFVATHTWDAIRIDVEVMALDSPSPTDLAKAIRTARRGTQVIKNMFVMLLCVFSGSVLGADDFDLIIRKIQNVDSPSAETREEVIHWLDFPHEPAQFLPVISALNDSLNLSRVGGESPR